MCLKLAVIKFDEDGPNTFQDNPHSKGEKNDYSKFSIEVSHYLLTVVWMFLSVCSLDYSRIISCRVFGFGIVYLMMVYLFQVENRISIQSCFAFVQLYN